MKKRVKSNMKNRIKFDLCVAACAAALVGFSAFGELTPKSWNGGASGDWGVAANWEPTGVPTADDAVTIGSGVVTASNLTVSVGSLTMGSGATLTVYAEAVDNSQDLTAFAGDGAVVNVAGDLALQSGAWIVPIAEPVSGGTVRFNVGGNVSIAEDGGFDATGKGWKSPYGPGFYGSTGWSDGHGGSYGGLGRTEKGGLPTGKTYGYLFAPFLPGSPGRNAGRPATIAENTGGRGGGAIRLHVTGDFELAGSLLADGVNGAGTVAAPNNGTSGAGSGGGIFVTCRNFTPASSAVISAVGADTRYGGAGAGGGGRIAIVADSPTTAQIESLYATGEAGNLLLVTTNVNDVAECPWPALCKLNGGKCWPDVPWAGDPGTGAYLCNLSSKRAISVSVVPSAADITLADLNLPVGSSLVSGEITATAAEYSFVPGTDSRERRRCLGFVFSNDVGTVVADAALSYAFDASAAAARSCLEWNYTDLEKRLVIAIDGEGEVVGYENWSDDGTVLTLTPVPAEGWRFLIWSGEVPSANLNDDPLSLTMSVPRDITAKFIPDVELTGEVAAVQNGEWFDAATWGGEGLPGPEAEVTIDGFAVRNTQASVPKAGSITLSGTGSLTLGELNCPYKPQLDVRGDLALSDTAVLTVYSCGLDAAEDPEAYVGDGAVISVGNDLTLSGSAVVNVYCHNTCGSSPRFTVGGDVTVGAEAKVDACGRGWIYGCGIGFANPNTDGCGGTYGGRGGGSSSTRTYGLVTAPFLPGSPGKAGWINSGNSGGGVIRIHADGKIMLAGTLDASAEDKSANHGPGSGGSVFLTCTEFKPSTGAKIKAHGGNSNYGWQGGGGGGRVAVVIGGLTAEQLDALYAMGEFEGMNIIADDLNDPNKYDAGYTDVVDVSGGTAKSSDYNGAKGTSRLLANPGQKRSLVVTLYPSAQVVTLPVCDPPPGMQMLEGVVSATAVGVSFVPGTDSRQRRNCTGYVYSNDVGTVTSEAALLAELDLSEAGEKAWLEWRYDDLEYLLRVTSVVGEGEFQNVGDWHDAGSSVTITAVPADGWKFACWNGELPVADKHANPLTVQMSSPRDISALFVPDSDPSGVVTAVKNGDWFDTSVWDVGAVPGANSKVRIDGKTVTTENPYDLKVGSLSLSGAAKLTLGMKDEEYGVNLVVGGDLVLTDTAQLTVYAGQLDTNDLVRYAKGSTRVSVGGNMIVGSGCWVYPFCHPTTGAAVAFSANRFDIAANAGFKAEKAGYAYCNGPGAYYGHIGKNGWTDEGHGASYGGVNARFRSSYPAQPTYGNPYAPFWAGSSGTTTGDSGSPGGGAIILNAMRDITLAGWLDADASATSASSGLGSGGSVWLRCKKLKLDAATAKITAKGGNNTWGGAGASGGGRICIAEGRPTDELIARVVNLGDRDDCPQVKGWQTVCTNLMDVAELSKAGMDENYTNVFSVVGGTDANYTPPWESHSTPGTAVWLKANRAGLAIMVR